MFRQRILETPLGLAWLGAAGELPSAFFPNFLGKAGDRGRGEMAAPHFQAVPLQELPTQAPPSFPQPNLCWHLMDQSRILPHPLSAIWSGLVEEFNKYRYPMAHCKEEILFMSWSCISQLSRAPAIPRDPASFKNFLRERRIPALFPSILIPFWEGLSPADSCHSRGRTCKNQPFPH